MSSKPGRQLLPDAPSKEESHSAAPAPKNCLRLDFSLLKDVGQVQAKTAASTSENGHPRSNDNSDSTTKPQTEYKFYIAAVDACLTFSKNLLECSLFKTDVCKSRMARNLSLLILDWERDYEKDNEKSKTEILDEIKALCQTSPEWHNEICLQLVKQTRGNPKPEAVWKLFEILSPDLVCHKDIEAFLENYLAFVCIEESFAKFAKQCAWNINNEIVAASASGQSQNFAQSVWISENVPPAQEIPSQAIADRYSAASQPQKIVPARSADKQSRRKALGLFNGRFKVATSPGVRSFDRSPSAPPMFWLRSWFRTPSPADVRSFRSLVDRDLDASPSDMYDITEQNRLTPQGRDTFYLQPGTILRNKFSIDHGVNERQSLMYYGTNTYSNQRVVLKFYKDRNVYNNAKSHLVNLNSPYITGCMDYIEELEYPCLVFERGDVTLAEWMCKEHNPLSRTSVLFQVLKALEHIHDKGLVHSNLKPSSIMRFPDDVWKIIDLDTVGPVNSEPPLEFSVAYAAPELLVGKSDRAKRHPSQDMWSVGVIACELFLNGRRFWGNDFTDESIIEFHKRGREPREQFLIEEERLRKFVVDLVKLDPAARLIASKACRRAIFRLASEDTTTRVARSEREQIEKEQQLHLSDIKQEVLINRVTSTVEASLTVQEFVSTTDSEIPFEVRSARDAVLVLDDNLPNETIYGFNVGKDYLIRAIFTSKISDRLPFSQVAWVTIKPLGEEAVHLQHVKMDMKRADICEIVAYINPDDFKEGSRLSQVSPSMGDIEEKFVPLDVNFGITVVESKVEAPVVLKKKIYCKMCRPNARLRVDRARMGLTRVWSRQSQTTRDIARGAWRIVSVAAGTNFPPFPI